MAQNPAWRTYKYTGKKKRKRNIADEGTTRKLIAALEEESIKYETYFKLIIATGMRRGECCGLKWKDVDFSEKSIHICRNVVKVTGEDILVKEPKTAAGDRYVYFSLEMSSLLKEYRSFCQGELELHEGRELTSEDYIFRRHGENLPMTPSTFTGDLVDFDETQPALGLERHSLRHTAASLMISGGADVATVSGFWATPRCPLRWIFTLTPLTRRNGRSAPRCRGGWGCKRIQPTKERFGHPVRKDVRIFFVN